MLYIKGNVRLTRREHGLLIEALRRRSRFRDNSPQKGITEQWTGLGSATEYAPAVKAGLMEVATSSVPRDAMTWWRLTQRGARIVVYWIANGWDHKRIEESGDFPPIEFPETIL